MKIGIIGSAAVGQTLGNAFLLEGNQVMLGSRNPSKKELAKWKKENAGGQTGTLTETAQFGEILVLATAGSGAEHAIRLAGVDHFDGKVVIDATNPTSDAPATNGVLHFFTSLEDSLLERLQRLVPEAKFVKAFNSAGSDYMYKPQFPGGMPTMFICGNDDAARAIVT